MTGDVEQLFIFCWIFAIHFLGRNILKSFVYFNYLVGAWGALYILGINLSSEVKVLQFHPFCMLPLPFMFIHHDFLLFLSFLLPPLRRLSVCSPDSALGFFNLPASTLQVLGLWACSLLFLKK